MTRVEISDAIGKAAAGLLAKDAALPAHHRDRVRSENRKRLKAIADGEHKLVDVAWWRSVAPKPARGRAWRLARYVLRKRAPRHRLVRC
jgi:hypothetical protein